MPEIKIFTKDVEYLALLLILTANITLIKVGAVSLSFFIGALILIMAANKKYLFYNKEFRTLVFFSILSVIALLLSPTGISGSSIFLALQIIYWFYIALLFRNIGSHISCKWIAKIVIFAEIVFSIVFFIYGEINPYLSANQTSFIIVTLWPFSLFISKKNYWRILVVLLAVVSLFLTGSRTGIIVVFVQLSTIYVVKNMTGSGKIILLASIVIFSAIISLQSVRTTIAKVVEPASPEISLLIEDPNLVLVMDKSWAQRRIQQEKCKQVFAQYPLIGVGPMNTINYNINIDITNLSDIDARVINTEMLRSDSRSSHNAYYQLIADNGAIGSLLLLLFFFYLLRGLYKKSLVSDNHIIFFISLIGLIINLYMVSALWGTNTWILLGMYASVLKMSPKL